MSESELSQYIKSSNKDQFGLNDQKYVRLVFGVVLNSDVRYSDIQCIFLLLRYLSMIKTIQIDCLFFERKILVLAGFNLIFLRLPSHSDGSLKNYFPLHTCNNKNKEHKQQRAGFELQTLGASSSDGDHYTMPLPLLKFVKRELGLNFKYKRTETVQLLNTVECCNPNVRKRKIFIIIFWYHFTFHYNTLYETFFQKPTNCSTST